MIEVSVILIVKNEADYIKKCLDSILSQSYTKFEIIIIDDNSSDGTKEIIKSFKDKRINLFNFSIANDLDGLKFISALFYKFNILF